MILSQKGNNNMHMLPRTNEFIVGNNIRMSVESSNSNVIKSGINAYSTSGIMGSTLNSMNNGSNGIGRT